LICPKFISLFLVLLSLSNQSAYSQSCDQLEILFNEPDCEKPQTTAAGARAAFSPGDASDVCQNSTSSCINTPASYVSSITGAGYTYLWSVTGPSTVTFLPNNMGPNVTISWPAIGQYKLNLTVNDGMGNILTACLNIIVKDKPVAGFTFGPNNVCQGSTINFTNTSTNTTGGMIYSWNFDDPTSGANNFDNSANPTHVFNTPGTYNVCLTASSFVTEEIITVIQGKEVRETLTKACCSDVICRRVTILPGDLKIECVATVCPFTVQTYNSLGCANTTWGTPVGGAITSSTPTSVTIKWGDGSVQGQIIANCSGGCTTSIPVPIIPATPTPVGNLKPCVDATTSYTLPILPGTFYNWSLENVTQGITYANSPEIYTYPENNTVWVNWAAVGSYPDVYKLKISLLNEHICCDAKGEIDITPKETFFATVVDPIICPNTTGTFNSFPSYGSFNWSVSPTAGVLPSTGTGPSFGSIFNSPGTYNITLSEPTSYCNTVNNVAINVLPVTPPTGSIVGSPTVCIGTTLSYNMSTPAPPGYQYKWSITGINNAFMPGNIVADVFGNNVNIIWNTIPGTVSVVLERTSTPLCTSASTSITVSAATVGVITGPVNTCVDTPASYTLSGGNLPASEAITWSIAPPNDALGTITTGQGTNNISILWHGGTPSTGPWGPVTLNATSTCGAATALSGITIYPKFSFTLQKNSVDICQPGGTTLSITPAPPANIASYLWTDATTGPTTSVFNAGLYALTVTNIGGCAFTNTILVDDPFKIATVCSAGICRGAGMEEQLQVFVTSPASGTFTYEWHQGTFPAGPIVQTSTSGALSDSYTATAAGNYWVNVVYGTGLGACTKTIPFTVAQVCCPDVNIPSITSINQLTCNQYSFTATTANINPSEWKWDFGDGNTQTGTLNPTHTYANAGIYCVKFCVGDPAGCGINCSLGSVTVPIKAAFISQLRCDGCVDISNTSINLASSPATVTSVWDFGDGSPNYVGTSPPQHCYPATGGVFTLTLTMTYDNGIVGPGNVTCQSIASQVITHSPLALSIIPNPVCTNIITNFSFTSNSSPIASNYWDFGDGFFAYSPTTTHAYLTVSPPTYNGELSIRDIYGTVCQTPFSLNVLAGTSCTIAPKFLCPNSTATLNGPAGPAGTTYLWQEFVAGNWVTPANPNTNIDYNTTTTGTFRVLVTSPNGCVCTSNTVNVLSAPAPVAKIKVTPSKKICVPGPTSFITLISENELPGYTSAWYNNSVSPANLINANSMIIGEVITATKTYVLVLTNEYGCTDECSIVVEVNPVPAPPIINSLPAGPLCEGQSITLTSSYVNNVVWNNGAITPAINVSNAGIYTVTYTDPITGCSSTSNAKTVSPRPSADLFPHFCDLISCECRLHPARPFSIYAPKPLIGPFATNYNIEWFSAPSNTPILPPAVSIDGLIYSNMPAGAPNGVPTGTYYIKMTDPNTGCSTLSETYSVVVPNCADCNCDNSKWEKITATSPGARVAAGPAGTISLECNQSYEAPCNVPITLDATFICSIADCPPTVTYTIIPPTGPSVLGNLPGTFTPTLSGTYTVVLNAYCNGVLCKTCIVKFVTSCGPLEINLLKFEGKKLNNTIELSWITGYEKNNDYFELEKVNEKSKFEKIATINSKQNRNEATAYNYTDSNPLNGLNYYKLKAIDLNGKITTSKIIGITYSEITVPKVYPNPTNATNITLEVPLDFDSKLTIEWFDLLGKVVKNDVVKGVRGINNIALNISDLPVGKYLIRINEENEIRQVSKIISFGKL
jgi:PKD repeat protein